MSRMSSALVAATALVLTAGAVQFASGRDLRGTVASAAAPTVATDAVNRAMKADRGSVQAQAHVAMQTFVIRPAHLIDTSVLVRVPVATPGKEANDVVRLPAAPSMEPDRGKCVEKHATLANPTDCRFAVVKHNVGVSEC